MAIAVNLRENETILKEFKGDYWEGGFISSQKPGNYCLTSQRILFQGGFATSVELPYTEIAAAALCNIGEFVKFLPTGILITMKDGKKHRLSVMKRKEILALIESKL